VRTRLLALPLVGFSVALAAGQSTLPPDIHEKSLTRLPPIERASLDDEGRRIWDYIAGAGRALPVTGPAPLTMYSPKSAEPIHTLNQYLRTTVVGPRYFELSALIAAREFDQQYEWSGHEPAGRRAGLEQAVIDAVKHNRDVAALPEKDATVIRLGRALFRDHKVSPALWAKTVELFGRQGAVEITAIMGDYAMAAVMLTAVDQQLPPGREALLPIGK
jgi:4-carboxymuconolactone decarboxylase